MKRLTFIYLTGYLLVGGFGLVVAPERVLHLLLSNGVYGEIMPRVAGVFMFVLGGMILQFVRNRDFRYYGSAIVGRCVIVVVFTALFFKTRDPLFLVLDTIVLVGLLPSIYAVTQN